MKKNKNKPNYSPKTLLKTKNPSPNPAPNNSLMAQKSFTINPIKTIGPTVMEKPLINCLFHLGTSMVSGPS